MRALISVFPYIILYNTLTARFPMSQIGAFRPFRRNRARLRDRRMSWVVLKDRAAIFLSYIEDETSVKSRNSKKFVPRFSQISRFFEFESGLRETERS